MRTGTRSYPYSSDDPLSLPAELARLRVEEPVARVQVETGDEVWLVTGYHEVRAVLSDRRFSRNVFRPDAARLIPGVPTRQVSSPFVEPPGHTRWRRIMARAFTHRQLERLRPCVEETVDLLLEGMVRNGPPADVMKAFAYPLSISVMCELLGIEAEQHRRFAALADAALTINGLSPEDKARAFTDLDRFSRDLLAAKRATPSEDLLSELVGIRDADDGRLSEDELVATILAMLVGGYESTVMQIGKSILALLRHPDQLAELGPPSTSAGSRAIEEERSAAVAAAVEETLRYAGLDSGFGSPRYALEEVEVGGVAIPKGATVLVLRAAANRDTTVFDDAERFDVHRERHQHFAFGFGPHICLGASLARMQLAATISALATSLPGLRLAVPADEVPWDYRITVAGPAELLVTW